ncbi:LPS assembly protein LptD [Pontibacterium granulatum]|uniref:LPS-assembly protein LptD n=1 Tax=Pontibacterium granulatum TaxID=2036029 RepID=UPI00249BB4D7|nr:LPS assembly protein LptD [Pontibacterium granulatum]MDI3322825.1 LPS assembly protein LptD [Pontibacterium granulatum]
MFIIHGLTYLTRQGVGEKPGGPVFSHKEHVDMPSIKPLSYFVALAVASIAYPQQSFANNSGEIWDCKASTSGSWDCDRKPAPSTGLATSSNASAESAKGPVATSAKELPSYKTLDWVKVHRPDQVCQGVYLEPTFQPQGDEDDPNAPVYLDAGKSQSELGGFTKLRDGVNLRQGSRRLSAETADVDQEKREAYFKDDVVYREPGMLVIASEAEVDLDTQQGKFKNARFVSHQDHMRGQAAEIQRNSDTLITLVDGDYTFCPPGNEDWKLSASKVELDQESGFGTATHARLKVGSVPIFYAPTLTFPIDDRRKSGFLYPHIGYSESDGIDLAAPYYFNLAPNYDDTLTPRWITERGVMLENEFRHLNERSETVIGTSYLPDDKLANDDRWLFNVKQKGNFAPGWRSYVDYTAVSDKNYFEDLTTNLKVQRESNLDRRGEVRYHAADWNALIRLHSYQTLVSGTAPYRRLPQVQLRGDYDWNETELQYLTEYVYFDRDTTGLTGNDLTTGSRIHFAPSISQRFSRSYGYVTPSLRLWNTQYELQDQVSGLDNSPTYSIPVTSIDSGLFFDRNLDSGGIQTLEPRLFALYVPDKDQSDAPDFDTSLLDFDYQSLFRYNRFSGRDRLGDAQQLSLGVTTRFLDDTGYESFNFSVGQAFYFDDRDVILNGGSVDTASQSNIATQATWNYSRQMRITLDNVLAYDDLNAEETNIRLRYMANSNQRLYFSYRFEEDVRDQTDFHFIWPMSQRFTAIGRWQHDLEAQQDLETTLGLEYESCCWKVQLYGRRYLTTTNNEFDDGIYLRFILKGLGSINSSSVGFLEDITGFEERDEQDDF